MMSHFPKGILKKRREDIIYMGYFIVEMLHIVNLNKKSTLFVTLWHHVITCKSKCVTCNANCSSTLFFYCLLCLHLKWERVRHKKRRRGKESRILKRNERRRDKEWWPMHLPGEKEIIRQREQQMWMQFARWTHAKRVWVMSRNSRFHM